MDWTQKMTVFLGDSITEGYGVSKGECWVDAMPGIVINRGISGDTTSGMLRRFQAHVLAERPDRVVIMGGINDLSEGGSLDTVQNHLYEMYECAQAHDITVVPAICVYPDYNELLNNDWAKFLPGIHQLPKKLEKLAEWIRKYALEHHCTCLDFTQEFEKYTIDGYCRYFSDGVHPNERGHAIMAEIAKNVLFPKESEK